MAMIKCPECQKDISDKAVSCPNCGCPVEYATSDTQTQQPELTPNNNKKPLNKKWLVAGVIAIPIIVLAIIIGIQSSKKVALDNYKKNYDSAVALMVVGATDAEEAGELIHDVWYNTIFEQSDSKTDKYTTNTNGYFYDDFNDSLNNLYNDTDFLEKISSIKNNKRDVINIMRELTNPPTEYKEAYESLKKCYDEYISLTNMIISPNGTLTSFTDEYNKLDSALAKDLESLSVYI